MELFGHAITAKQIPTGNVFGNVKSPTSGRAGGMKDVNRSKRFKMGTT